MIINNTNNSFSLRRTTPSHYLFIIILIILTLAWLPYMVNTHDWAPLRVLPLGLFLLIPSIYMDKQYRIWWSNDAILRRTAGFRAKVTKIKVEHIENIAQETSDFRTLISLSRPLRRISIYGNTADGLQKIDISIKHFEFEDIRKIMQLIKEKRPDLSIPQQWLDDTIPISKIKSEINYGTSKKWWQLLGLLILVVAIFIFALKFSPCNPEKNLSCMTYNLVNNKLLVTSEINKYILNS